jgi:formiminotetrahydrofolate cyclodeaminase
MSSEIELAKTNANIELKKIEATSSAKEVSSKYIGKSAIPWIVLLVIVGVAASAFLPGESLPAVIGLVSTAVMAMISMIAGITGTKDKEEKPELAIIEKLIKNIEDAREPMTVIVDGDKVTVTKGQSTITTSRPVVESEDTIA